MEQNLLSQLPFFKENKKKETFISVLGALSIRLISLRKAAEILGMNEDQLINLFDAIGFNFSYLENEDIEIEKK
jgi:hypothetical protein